MFFQNHKTLVFCGHEVSSLRVEQVGIELGHIALIGELVADGASAHGQSRTADELRQRTGDHEAQELTVDLCAQAVWVVAVGHIVGTFGCDRADHRRRVEDEEPLVAVVREHLVFFDDHRLPHQSPRQLHLEVIVVHDEAGARDGDLALLLFSLLNYFLCVHYDVVLFYFRGLSSHRFTSS